MYLSVRAEGGMWLRLQVEEFNAEQIMSAVDQSMIERIFTTSVHLDSQAIQHFVIKLCEVRTGTCTVLPGSGFTSVGC